jgi:hypothetical protein
VLPNQLRRRRGQVAVELHDLTVGLRPAQRPVVVELLGSEELLPLKDHPNAGGGEDERRAEGGAFTRLREFSALRAEGEKSFPKDCAGPKISRFTHQPF